MRGISVMLLAALVPGSWAATPLDATWCGKYYQPSSPTTAPSADSFFSAPALSSTPLLNFRCAQAVRPYVAGDKTASIVVDAAVNYQLGTAWASSTFSLSLSVTVGGKAVLTNATLASNTTGTQFTFDLDHLTPQTAALDISCSAEVTGGGATYAASSTFLYLPTNPHKGSVVKMDKMTGGILVPNKVGNSWEPLFPLGFFTTFEGYLDTNLSVLDEMKANGINVVHPIPPFTSQSALTSVLDKMEELGLWLMYDMRYSYSNATARAAEVESIRTRSNLLLWYTGDEPDGSADQVNATTEAYDAIMAADGYHPISLVLNCADYKWTDYSAGADIIMQDTYPLFTDVTFSSKYNTTCTTEFGCCGCDNCVGNLTDIATRIDSYYDRIHLTGRDRNATVWSTFQTFEGDFWDQYPTGDEVLAMAVLSINHGSTGIISWQLPTSAAILSATSSLGSALSAMTPFTLSSLSEKSTPSTSSALSASLWTLSNTSLLLIANLQNASSTASLSSLPASAKNVTQILGNVKADWTGNGMSVTLGSFGVGGWTFNHDEVATPAGGSGGTAGSGSAGSQGKSTGGVIANPFWGLGGMCATGSLAAAMCW